MSQPPHLLLRPSASARSLKALPPPPLRPPPIPVDRAPSIRSQTSTTSSQATVHPIGPYGLDATSEPPTIVSNNTSASAVIGLPSVNQPDHTKPYQARYLNFDIPYGRHRFSKEPRPCFETADTYAGRYQEVHPGPIMPEEFTDWWNREPIIFLEGDALSYTEWQYRGVKERFNPRKEAIPYPLHRGDTIVIAGQSEETVKYIITYRRGTQGDTAIVQANAFTQLMDLVSPDQPDWPAILIEVPSILCNVPFPAILRPYFPEHFEADELAPPIPSAFSLHRYLGFLGFRRKTLLNSPSSVNVVKF